MNFARMHLSPQGKMLMVYSDLAFHLGLQEEHRVEKLANKFGLHAQLVDTTSMGISGKMHDPLRTIKSESSAQLFVVTK
eukprot:CAMPEP_0176351362 /NCGR_PEP_ID=MMETSP0126-20121128/10174_1 /TAXON_ID=141414 ORGANISM="Strombidinopsis acuminatum, Strain SPMC142" /NCGR_SAMPLE_ID=MMETSP0126 /ASSEMBLY_ACC=CAM_ASM_000229 /LENGTH=78 /DNA_ID=CAMNT_0017701847 /DNA_START=558 /DNA_END=794 /DNA_ORIENTATION=-